jgi:hypothetical protein
VNVGDSIAIDAIGASLVATTNTVLAVVELADGARTASGGG